MDRSEATGFGIATAGHVGLFALLSVGFATTQIPQVRNDPIEVAFVDEVGLESTAPDPVAEAAPLAAPEDGPPLPAMPAPPAMQQVPAPQPQPQPRQRAVSQSPAPAAKPRAAPPAAAVPRQLSTTKGGSRRFSVDLSGVTDRDSSSRQSGTPAATAGPAVQASLIAEVRRRVKPHWKAPTGADAEQLRTDVLISLDKSGRVTNIEVLSTSGQTASNRPQVALHREQAMRAVRLGAPFALPAQFYDAWKQVKITFDKRLSQ